MQSCDVYFYQLALDVGIDDMATALKLFGFGAPTGLDIPGERTGVVPSPEWKKKSSRAARTRSGSPARRSITGIGQGFMLVTPLQLASAAATMAARGKRFAPRLLIGVERRRDARDGQDVEPQAAAARRTIRRRSIGTIVHEAMIGVTAEPRGTARTPMKGTSYKVAGKTGTAQVFTVGQDEKYREADVEERLRDNGLFVAFAPAEDPQIALAVIVENGGGGARAAAPIARKVFDAYFTAEGYVAREP